MSDSPRATSLNEPECCECICISYYLPIPTVLTVSFSSETYVAAESAGSVEVCVILNIPYSFVLEFTVNARDVGSATAGTFRYHVNYNITVMHSSY